MNQTSFPPNRAHALDRLHDFVPRAGRAYAAQRNYDRPGHSDVSRLSPYLRHRLITEEETLAAVLAEHSPASAEKFIQEVFWRTYWKGWLEQRPAVWQAYRSEVARDWDQVQSQEGLRRDWEAACLGKTGIDAFDHWAHELADTGYLHNHARMWFASIWIFTLGLPWSLGADFFLRHLLDGDAASNTLGWRWVAGLQTQGKHYIARPSNIDKYTESRFKPANLVTDAAPLQGPPHPDRVPLPANDTLDQSLRTGLLLTDDDLDPGPLLEVIAPVSTLALCSPHARSPLMVSENVTAFAAGAVDDVLHRFDGALGHRAGTLDSANAVQGIVDWAQSSDLGQVVMWRPMVGPASDTLDGLADQLNSNGIRSVMRIRDYDARCWPHATAGFFKFKKRIPDLLEQRQFGLV